MSPHQQLAAFRALERIAPPVAGAVAERMWFTPSRPSGGRRPLPKTVEALRADPASGRTMGFRSGSGPLILAVHGWGGHPGQFLPLGDHLRRADASVVAIELPAHGTDPRQRTNVFEMATAVEHAVAEHGRPELVVAHSLGAMAVVLALGTAPPPTVFVAPVLSVETALDGFAAQAGLRPATQRRLTRRIRRFVGDDRWPRLAVGGDLVWGADLSIYHDPADQLAPIDVSHTVATRSERATLIEAPGSGHYRILRDPTFLAGVQALTPARSTN